MNPERVTGRFVHAYYTLFVGRPLRDQEKGITLTRLYSESATFSVAQTSQGGQKKVKGASVSFSNQFPFFRLSLTFHYFFSLLVTNCFGI